jgi:hypothetical protein
MSFESNWYFAEKHMNAIRDILQKNACYIVRVDVATPDEDMKQSTDLKVTVKAGAVAVRVRRKDKRFRDVTIRAYKNGNKTEIHKLRDGYGDWYLYAWELESGALEWVLLDIGKMRNAGLFGEKRPIIMNKDGQSGFVAYSIDEIKKAGALVNECLSVSAEVTV